MSAPSFLTRPMSVWLDLVRGIAALAVVVGHAHQFAIYSGPYPFSWSLQQNAVIVFFVLSGVVIAASVDRNRPSLSSYVIARASRIVPVALAAIALSLAVAAYDASLGPGMRFPADRDWADPVQTLRALLFLSESYASVFTPNEPYWSLCYEVWFYALFAAATFLRGPSRLIWLALLALAAGPNILLLLPAWLLGMHVARRPDAAIMPEKRAVTAVAVGVSALFIVPVTVGPLVHALAAILPWQPHFSYRMLSDLLLALAVAYGFIGLRALCERGFVLPAWSERPIRYLAGISFSIYLLHWPLLKLAVIMGVDAGQSPLAFAAIIAGVVAISAAFASVTERKCPAIRAFLETIFAARSRGAAEAAG